MPDEQRATARNLDSQAATGHEVCKGLLNLNTKWDPTRLAAHIALEAGGFGQQINLLWRDLETRCGVKRTTAIGMLKSLEDAGDLQSHGTIPGGRRVSIPRPASNSPHAQASIACRNSDAPTQIDIRVVGNPTGCRDSDAPTQTRPAEKEEKQPKGGQDLDAEAANAARELREEIAPAASNLLPIHHHGQRALLPQTPSNHESIMVHPANNSGRRNSDTGLKPIGEITREVLDEAEQIDPIEVQDRKQRYAKWVLGELEAVGETNFYLAAALSDLIFSGGTKTLRTVEECLQIVRRKHKAGEIRKTPGALFLRCLIERGVDPRSDPLDSAPNRKPR